MAKKKSVDETVDKKKTKKQTNLEKAIAEPGVVKFTLTCSKLKELTKITKIITDKAVLEFGMDGLIIKTVDSHKTYAGEVFIAKDGFVEYECRRDIKMGIDVGQIHEFLSGVKPSEQIECNFNDQTLKAMFYAGHLSRQIKLFDNFADLDTWRRDKVNVSWPHVFEDIDDVDIAIAMKGAEDVNEKQIIFESTKKGFKIRAIDESLTDDIEIPFNFDEKAKQVLKSMFPTDQLKSVIRASRGKIKLSMGDNYPLNISWTPEENMTATFLISPLTGGD
jgi:DNA polymerase III sliding clamp (beta) subunit (PCNA family)